jgi:pimeloyl-ACP methyl ester carboxylesterase
MARMTANGVALEYDVAGPESGPPILLIMGFGAQMTSWTPSFRTSLAEAGYRVVRFDNRDVGLSQKFSGIPNAREAAAALADGRKPDVPYTLDDMADDAAAVLANLGIGSAHIAGASMGGMIAQLVALRHPGRTRSLISIFSTTSDPSLPRSSPEAQAALMTPAPSTDKADVVAHAVKMRRAYASTKWPYDETWIAKSVAENFDRSFYPEGQARQWAAIMASAPRTDMLKALKVPALVMHGTADTLIRWEAGLHTAQCIPGSEFVLIDGWGHDMPEPAIPVLAGHVARFAGCVEAMRSVA